MPLKLSGSLDPMNNSFGVIWGHLLGPAFGRELLAGALRVRYRDRITREIKTQRSKLSLCKHDITE